MKLRRSYVYAAVAVLAALVLYVGWAELTERRGSQRVALRPAAARCGVSGPLRFCVYRARAGVNGDVVYHLHGRNLDEHAWNDDTYFPALVQAEWQRSRTLPPTVVTVSYGGEWLLAPRGREPDSGLLEDLMKRLSRIEQQVGRPRRRILLGESMGGLNVLVAGLSYPTKFAKVAALCPGVFVDSPFASLATIRASMARTGADPKIVAGIWLLARRYAADDAEWQRIAPLRLIERAGPRSPALYLSNGLYDGYGNFEGSQRLAERAQQRGVATEWHPLYGGHCAIDAVSLARFLAS